MARWRWCYEIDLDKDDGVVTPEDAARKIYDLISDPASYHPVITIVNVDTGQRWTIDLEEDRE